MIIIPRWRLKRAIRQVIQIFQKHNATDAKSAKTDEELRLRPQGFMEGMFKGRDYKPYALGILMRAEIVQQTKDGRLYLSEEKLSTSNLGKFIQYSR
jgi:hypothetical protein